MSQTLLTLVDLLQSPKAEVQHWLGQRLKTTLLGLAVPDAVAGMLSVSLISCDCWKVRSPNRLMILLAGGAGAALNEVGSLERLGTCTLENLVCLLAGPRRRKGCRRWEVFRPVVVEGREAPKAAVGCRLVLLLI